jgi:hypothetical protein
MNRTQPIAVGAYSFPERALRRWARENLSVVPRADGGVDAVFRFEGSTCGNVAFCLLYRVSVGPEAGGRRLETLWCEPVPHDEGHTRMCCWLENAADIAAILRHEAALGSQPLDAVLTWRPQKSPAGCLCTESSRHHKWQAVLETLHFALVPSDEPSPFHENRTRT